MNFELSNIPDRGMKPRSNGLTMMIDKGLSCMEIENLMEVGSNYIDIVKLGWSTSFVIQNLKEKLAQYKQNGIPVYFGGTLFEAYMLRDEIAQFKALLDKYELEYVEISDGSIELEHEKKCKIIKDFAKHRKVLSEIGSKDEQEIIPPYKWIELMQAEKEAGSWKLIAESRESGNVGIYRSSGEVRQGLVKEILTQVPSEDIIWEAPQKSQQVWFVNLIGANVNMGNISPVDIISLETIRVGMRSDTLHNYIAVE